MAVVLTNNASGVLASGINASATQLQLEAGQGAAFPALGPFEFFFATLVSNNGQLEIVRVTARSADVFTVVRAQENTTARTFSKGSFFELRVTVGNILALIPDPQITVASSPPPNPVLNQLWLEVS